MKYLADTIVKYITEDSTGEGAIKFVLPSYPSGLLLNVGVQLEEHFSRIADRRVSFLYGIACHLGDQWEESGSAQDKENLRRIREKGWHNTGNNLTSIRNHVRDPKREDSLVTLIAGYEHIDDRASLRDFFHLDQRSIWELCLKRTFKHWVATKLNAVLDPVDSEIAVDCITDVLDALYNHGLADMPGISRYLEGLDLDGVSTGNEAYRAVLGNLSVFNLPPMTSMARGGGRKSFVNYFPPAQEFFNYGTFLDATAREKAKKAINDFEAADKPEPDEDILGDFDSVHELLVALRRYVTDRAEGDRQQLLTADFPFILDKVLGYRKKGKTPTPPTRKLRGLAPEVFLRALWLTLGDYVKDAKSRSVLPEEDLREVRLRSLLFRHDFDEGGDGSSGDQADRDRAKTFLHKVLGGIDDLLEQHLQLGDWLEDGDGERTVKVRSELEPDSDNGLLGYQKTSVAEPTLKFEVVLAVGDDEPFKRQYMWCLPQHHQARLLVNLYDWAHHWFQDGGDGVPTFALPYVPEVFLARDEAEVSRVAGTALSSENRPVCNLLTAAGIDTNDSLMAPLHKLSAEYQRFLEDFQESGFFTALDNSFDGLRKAYFCACSTYLEHSHYSTLAPLVTKAFSVVDIRTAEAQDWAWRDYVEYMIATPLHPAVLEMIRYQHSFLCESFCYYASDALKEPGVRQFAEKSWDRVVDLAKIERPLFGTLKDVNRVLDSNVRSYGYLHLVGECLSPSEQVISRLLLDYDGEEEEEEITDADLFRETRASQLVRNTLLDYWKLTPYVDDGINVGAYCGQEIQPLIAGIDDYLETILASREQRPYWLRVTVFAGNRDDSSVTRWLEAWRDRWQEAELSSSRRHYGSCRIEIAYRVFPEEGSLHKFANLLHATALDLMFFTDFVRTGASRFEAFEVEAFPEDDYRKFPVLEKACCAVTGGGKASQRERLLSNGRFTLATLHAEVMARMSKGHLEAARRHAVISYSDFQPWRSIVDAAHEGCVWVVCVDPSVDDLLLRRIDSTGTKQREIIGFGTGVGAHGENNYTVSTEQFAMVDVKKNIGSQLSVLFGPWDSNTRDRVADSLVDEASRIAGLSIVKATGPSEYVRDYIAYATIRKLLARDSEIFCDEVVSLDAFRHWFDDAEKKTRPDLLRLRARIVDGYFDIQAQIIECKLAQQSEDYLSKAHDQVEAGLRRLLSCFRPREEGKPVGVGDKPEQLRPDQRYWWLQLHRLVASRGSTSKPKYADTLAALERLSEGYFHITWQGAVVAFWTDVAGDSLVAGNERLLSLEGTEIAIRSFVAGNKLIRNVSLQGLSEDFFADVSHIRLSFRQAQEVERHSSQDIVEAGNHEASGGETEKIQPLSIDVVPGDGKVKVEDEHTKLGPRHIPDRIPLGQSTAGGKAAFWEFGHRDLPNRHILLFGASGTGKTYAVEALLCELSKAGQNALIVDYTSGFTSEQLEDIVKAKLKPRQHVVRRQPLPINPFRQQSDFLDGEALLEDPTITAQRVSGVFDEVYGLGDQQKSVLYSAVRDGIASESTSFTLDRLMERLDDLREEGGPVANSAATLFSKIQPFVDMTPFGQEDPESWERLFSDEDVRCHIIQLAGFSKYMASLITEFSLIDLYRYYRARGNKDKPKVIVLDEIQNLDHKLESPLGQMLTEGRKFGISLILATQTLRNLSNDEQDRLFQAAHKLFFKPADTELKSFAQILESATGEKAAEWIKRLSSLNRGECYSIGPVKNDMTGTLDMKKFSRIRIKVLDERF